MLLSTDGMTFYPLAPVGGSSSLLGDGRWPLIRRVFTVWGPRNEEDGNGEEDNGTKHKETTYKNYVFYQAYEHDVVLGIPEMNIEWLL
jgi:hypothetical protein